MADLNVIIRLLAENQNVVKQIGTDLDKLNQASTKSNQQIGKLNQSFSSLGRTILGAAGVGFGLREIVQNLNEYDRSVTSLNRSIQTNIRLNQDSLRGFTDQQRALSNLSGATENQIRLIQSYAANLGLAQQQAESFTNAVIALSQRTSQSSTEISNSLTQAVRTGSLGETLVPLLGGQVSSSQLQSLTQAQRLSVLTGAIGSPSQAPAVSRVIGELNNTLTELSRLFENTFGPTLSLLAASLDGLNRTLQAVNNSPVLRGVAAVAGTGVAGLAAGRIAGRGLGLFGASGIAGGAVAAEAGFDILPAFIRNRENRRTQNLLTQGEIAKEYDRLRDNLRERRRAQALGSKTDTYLYGLGVKNSVERIRGLRGELNDLGTGAIIGATFKNIASSLSKLLPLLGRITAIGGILLALKDPLIGIASGIGRLFGRAFAGAGSILPPGTADAFRNGASFIGAGTPFQNVGNFFSEFIGGFRVRDFEQGIGQGLFSNYERALLQSELRGGYPDEGLTPQEQIARARRLNAINREALLTRDSALIGGGIFDGLNYGASIAGLSASGSSGSQAAALNLQITLLKERLKVEKELQAIAQTRLDQSSDYTDDEKEALADALAQRQIAVAQLESELAGLRSTLDLFNDDLTESRRQATVGFLAELTRLQGFDAAASSLTTQSDADATIRRLKLLGVDLPEETFSQFRRLSSLRADLNGFSEYNGLIDSAESGASASFSRSLRNRFVFNPAGRQAALQRQFLGLRIGSAQEQLSLAQQLGDSNLVAELSAEIENLTNQLESLKNVGTEVSEVFGSSLVSSIQQLKNGTVSLSGAISELGASFLNGLFNILLNSAANNVATGLFGSAGLFSGFSGLFGGANSFFGNSIPAFADGGVVPGGLGRPIPILAHGGEVVLNPRQQAMFNGSSGFTIINTASNDQLQRAVYDTRGKKRFINNVYDNRNKINKIRGSQVLL